MTSSENLQRATTFLKAPAGEIAQRCKGLVSDAAYRDFRDTFGVGS